MTGCRPELVLDLKTTKALGLPLPPSLLPRADQMIERWAGGAPDPVIECASSDLVVETATQTAGPP